MPFKNIELSPRALLEIRIKSLEAKFREVYKTIDFANKSLLEYELGTAYHELKTLIKDEYHERKRICSSL